MADRCYGIKKTVENDNGKQIFFTLALTLSVQAGAKQNSFNFYNIKTYAAH